MDATLPNPSAPEALAPAAPEAQAPVITPAPAPADTAAPSAPAAPVALEPVAPAAPAITPEQDAVNKQLAAQAAVNQVIKSKEDQCAAEIAKVCEKFGCDLIVGHSVKVKFRNQAQQ